MGLLADAEQLASSVHSTSELSERVSFKVRELDTAQSRINDTLQRISIVVDRSSAVNGIRSALETGDYEAAAEHVSKYLSLEQRFGAITDELDSRQLQEQQRVGCPMAHLHAGTGVSCLKGHAWHDDMMRRQVVEDAKVRLRGDILSKLEQAKKQGDHRTVLRFTRLYAPLGLQVCAAACCLSPALHAAQETHSLTSSTAVAA